MTRDASTAGGAMNTITKPIIVQFNEDIEGQDLRTNAEPYEDEDKFQ